MDNNSEQHYCFLMVDNQLGKNDDSKKGNFAIGYDTG